MFTTVPFFRLLYSIKHTFCVKFFQISFCIIYSTIQIMNICCLNVGSKLRLKLGTNRHTLTTLKAFPEPYAFSQHILIFLVLTRCQSSPSSPSYLTVHRSIQNLINNFIEQRPREWEESERLGIGNKERETATLH